MKISAGTLAAIVLVSPALALPAPLLYVTESLDEQHPWIFMSDVCYNSNELANTAPILEPRTDANKDTVILKPRSEVADDTVTLKAREDLADETVILRAREDLADETVILKVGVLHPQIHLFRTDFT
jgi:hypothetical protein